MKVLLIVLALALVGCSENKVVNSGKTLLALQHEIVAVHEAFVVPCKTGTVKKEDCQKVEDLTAKAATAYDLAVDAAVLGTTSGDSVVLTETLTDMTKLLTQYGLGVVK